MKNVRFVVCGVVLTLLLGEMASAEGWSLQKFNDGAKKLATDTSDGTKRLVQNTSDGTKRFFVGAKDMLTWKKSTKKSVRPISPYHYLKPEPPQKTSWFGSLFRREDPKPASSLEEFMSLQRLDP